MATTMTSTIVATTTGDQTHRTKSNGRTRPYIHRSRASSDLNKLATISILDQGLAHEHNIHQRYGVDASSPTDSDSYCYCCDKSSDPGSDDTAVSAEAKNAIRVDYEEIKDGSSKQGYVTVFELEDDDSGTDADVEEEEEDLEAQEEVTSKGDDTESFGSRLSPAEMDALREACRELEDKIKTHRFYGQDGAHTRARSNSLVGDAEQSDIVEQVIAQSEQGAEKAKGKAMARPRSKPLEYDINNSTHQEQSQRTNAIQRAVFLASLQEQAQLQARADRAARDRGIDAEEDEINSNPHASFLEKDDRKKSAAKGKNAVAATKSSKRKWGFDFLGLRVQVL